MIDPLVSIIIPCKNEGENIRHTITSIRENSGQTPYEIIVVDDASNDDCCDFLINGQIEGVTLVPATGVHANRARNMGADRARGQYFVFCDAHIFVEKDWLEKILEVLQKPGVDALSPCIKPHDYLGTALWGGLTWEPDMSMRWLPNHGVLTPVPVLTAGCLAIGRETFHAVGGFDKKFKVYGMEDVEFTLKLWLFGYQAYVTSEVTYRHIFRSAHPYPVKYEDIHHNLLRIAFLHLNKERISKIIGQIKSHPHFSGVLADLVLSNILADRLDYLARRKFDDDWFLQKFNIPF